MERKWEGEGQTFRVVVIGGGTGLSVLLRGLKELPFFLTAIVTVADDGGSSGVLREEMKMPPPGDVRNVLLALADTEPLLEKVLQHRFVNGSGLAGHSLGNLLIAAMKEITGDFVLAVKELSKVLAVRGEVLPAANQAIVLKAELEDGTIVSGESLIPKSGKKITRVFLHPKDVKPLQEALEALKQADAIIVGPGSLYTSILPNLLVPGIVEMIRSSSALKIFICNVMTQRGETENYSAADHIQAIHDHVGSSLFQYVIVNNQQVDSSVLSRYVLEGAKPVAFDEERLWNFGYRVIADQFLKYHTHLRHDAGKLSKTIWEILLRHRK
ncbi:YvcK family protein [Microaerobacter geothermalis]|uniref:gluconeogenesis factor YvcK family protein n=1 Tax=Microaerobacter geothermalis TaxID=674972 RepID=UPI001F383F36|nr:YvcK family protein [Microaerobacter geothermalis]MCF6094577.1 YvcK family protein [Microaerobacter geothermalis]